MLHVLPSLSAIIIAMKLKLFLTGGTFDKEYDELTGELFFKETHVHEMLSLGRSRVKVDTKTLMMVDSLDMTEVQRDLIAQNVLTASEKNIVVIHGTDTMVKTAKVIAERGKDKTVILTGAMVPYKFGSSDGLFNLGSALAFAQTLPAGVYIAMNGRYFTYDNCVKNTKTGQFEELGSSE